MTINSAVSEGARIEMNLCGDQRLLGAVGSAGSFVAERAGLGSEAQAEVAAAAEEACRAAIPLLDTDSPTLNVTVQQFSERIEITIAHRENGSKAPPTQGVSGSRTQRIALFSKIDSVRRTSENGISKMTLIKNLH